MKGKVIVRLKTEVSDPQGITIQQSVQSLGQKKEWAEAGFNTVRKVRVGRIFEVELDAPNAEAARKTLEKLCDRILANPIIEDYTFDLEENSK
jgi:phosphoribosylformylglycinamidine synthase